MVIKFHIASHNVFHLEPGLGTLHSTIAFDYHIPHCTNTLYAIRFEHTKNIVPKAIDLSAMPHTYLTVDANEVIKS